MPTISVVIATKNEEHNIRQCLEHVQWADEIVIVDDVSTDKTVAISKEFTDKVFVRDSQGSFHANKNYGLEMATGEWLFSIDADEIVPGELADEVVAAIGRTDKAGFYVPRKNYFLGTWITGCGWWPEKIIRIWKKGESTWPLEIHSPPVISGAGKVGTLRQALIHHTYQNLFHYFDKFNRYTTRLAQEQFEKGINIKGSNMLLYFCIKPAAWFFRKYLLQKGFMNGFPGLFISLSSAMVIFTTYAKLWEKQQK
jgi:glycosyltransferase involved in cell wall biosynthesis